METLWSKSQRRENGSNRCPGNRRSERSKRMRGSHEVDEDRRMSITQLPDGGRRWWQRLKGKEDAPPFSRKGWGVMGGCPIAAPWPYI